MRCLTRYRSAPFVVLRVAARRRPLSYALRLMACPTRCRSAPFVVLRAVPWRRMLSSASLPCRRNGLRAWRPARLLRGDLWLSSSSFLLCVISSAWPFVVRLTFVFLGRQCYANVLAKAHVVGGGFRARVSRRDLREHPGAHYEMCARPRSGAVFGHIRACDIRCSRSAVLQPPGRTPAMVARGTRYALPLGAFRCLPRCPVAQDFV